MPEFPGVTHVALTVRTLGGVAPGTDLIGSPPVIDEDTGPFHRVVWLLGSQTLVGIHQSEAHGSDPFDERRPGLDHVVFGCGAEPSSSSGSRSSASWALRTAESSTPLTVRDSRSAIPTTSRWSSSPRLGSRRSRRRADSPHRRLCVGVGVAVAECRCESSKSATVTVSAEWPLRRIGDRTFSANSIQTPHRG